jgi:catechol 2,3-dioxygenase-like lactoylglutathione lyase family enzyme
MAPTFFAIGICVRDLDRSTRFYMEVLGAELDLSVDLPAELRGNHRALTEIPNDVLSRARFLKVGGSTVELLDL